MKLTTNLGLKKPDGTDVVNIDDLNYNADILDIKINTIGNSISENKDDISSLKNDISKFTRNYALNEIDISDDVLTDNPGGFTVGIASGVSKGLPYDWCIIHQIGSGMTHFKVQVCYSADNGSLGKISIRQKYATTEWTAWKEIVNPYSYLNTLSLLEQQISEIEIQLMENEV